MGFFDSYEPIPDLRCPICENVLNDWQGIDAACGLFVWQQGIAYPVDQTGSESNIDEADRKKFRLPEEFEIYANCENCGDVQIIASCKTEDEIWNETVITKTEKLPKLPRKWFKPE
jgi:hypothetical protein